MTEPLIESDLQAMADDPYNDPLELYTLYDRPRDYPNKVVLRRWKLIQNAADIRRDDQVMWIDADLNDVDQGRYYIARPDLLPLLFDDIESARDHCRDLGLYCLGRDHGDKPQIKETWI